MKRVLRLIFIFSFSLLSLSCLPHSTNTGYLNPIDSPFEIVRGREKVHLLTQGKMLGLGDPRIYTAKGKQNEVFLTEVLPDYTYAPGFIWKPENIETQPSIWKFNIRTFAVERIRFEEFQALAPKAQLDASKPTSFSSLPLLKLAGTEKVVPDRSVYGNSYACCRTAPDASLTAKDLRNPEVRVYPQRAKKYAIALSLSNLNIFRRKQYFTGLEGYPFASGDKGWQTVEYYSGTMHIEVFELSAPTRAIIYLQKQFENWTQLPSLLEFLELSPLPNGEPCLVLNSSSLFSTRNQTSALLIP